MQTIDLAPDAKAKEYREQIAKRARDRGAENLFPKIASNKGGRLRPVDQPPLLYHVAARDAAGRFRKRCCTTASPSRTSDAILFDRYRLEDFALKVVGIGSVGTRCMVGLYSDPQGGPLMPQIKEAGRFASRALRGQERLRAPGPAGGDGTAAMQSSSAIFLGWSRGRPASTSSCASVAGHEAVRADRCKVSAEQLARYTQFCG
jgi:hypothetical protein